MADTRIRSWTISAGVVGRKPGRRGFGSASATMRIKAGSRLTTVTWDEGGGVGGRQVWGSVLATLVRAE